MNCSLKSSEAPLAALGFAWPCCTVHVVPAVSHPLYHMCCALGSAWACSRCGSPNSVVYQLSNCGNGLCEAGVFSRFFFTGVLNFWVCRQNEKQVVPTDVKVDFINRLSRTGLRSIEATSFVSAKWVPQMGDNAEVMARIRRQPGVSYPVLTPNMKGFESALEAGATEVAIFAAASDGFSMKNINCNVMESFERFRPVCQAAIAAGVKVRGCVGVTAVGALR